VESSRGGKDDTKVKWGPLEKKKRMKKEGEESKGG
jgi:hypothetical protein